MKLKKYVCAIVICLLFVTGCSGNDVPAGKIEEISTMQVSEKFNNKDSFVVVLTQTTCAHCRTFLAMAEKYVKSHSLVLYDVILDKEPSRDQALRELETLFPGFVGTPDVYYVEDGKIKSNYNDELEEEESMDAITFDNWVNKHNIVNE